jgi:hypothetical protein
MTPVDAGLAVVDAHRIPLCLAEHKCDGVVVTVPEGRSRRTGIMNVL